MTSGFMRCVINHWIYTESPVEKVWYWRRCKGGKRIQEPTMFLKKSDCQPLSWLWFMILLELTAQLRKIFMKEHEKIKKSRLRRKHLVIKTSFFFFIIISDSHFMLAVRLHGFGIQLIHGSRMTWLLQFDVMNQGDLY